jgi:hypothetical protein
VEWERVHRRDDNRMTIEHALDLVVARTGHIRYRWLCSDENPNVEQREGYRRVVLAKASGQRIKPIAVDYGDPPPARKGGCCG